MEDLKQQVRTILTPIEEEFFEAILEYNGTFQVCGYAASIITKLLQGKLPSEQVRMGYGYQGPEEKLNHHYWTEINERLFVDATYGQYNPRQRRVILIEEIKDMARFDLTRLDRQRPEEFSPLITERCGRKTVMELVEKPDEPFIPGFQWVWGLHKIEYTLEVVRKLEERLGIL